VFVHPINKQWLCTALGYDGGYWVINEVFDKAWLLSRIRTMSKFLGE
jgi:hypothetical protein